LCTELFDGLDVGVTSLGMVSVIGGVSASTSKSITDSWSTVIRGANLLDVEMVTISEDVVEVMEVVVAGTAGGLVRVRGTCCCWIDM